MRVKSIGILILSIFTIVGYIQKSKAQLMNSDIVKIDDSSFAVGFHGHAGASFGAVFPESVTYKGQGLLGGLPVTADGKLSLHPAVAEVAVADYAVTRFLNLEFQIGHSEISFDKFNGDLGVGGIYHFQGRADISGSIEGISGLFNIAVSPLGQDNILDPVFGGGIGFTSSRASLKSISGFGLALPIEITSSETDFTADLFAALEVRLIENFYAGVAYQFIWIEGGNIGTSQQFAAQNGAFRQHFLGIIAEYKF